MPPRMATIVGNCVTYDLIMLIKSHCVLADPQECQVIEGVNLTYRIA